MLGFCLQAIFSYGTVFLNTMPLAMRQLSAKEIWIDLIQPGFKDVCKRTLP